MHELLSDKKVIFIDRPASGDWLLTKRFCELAGERLRRCTPAEIDAAQAAGAEYLGKNHRLGDVEEEVEQFLRYYRIVSDALGLGLTGDEIAEAAMDRTYNMDNYVIYPDARRVIETLSRTHRLGIISDTWPSIENQLRALDVRQFFSFATYSFALGVFKPDRRMYLDALEKSGCPAEETVFIDDSPRNLAGAAALGITPILIAADPASDAETPYARIRALSELL